MQPPNIPMMERQLLNAERAGDAAATTAVIRRSIRQGWQSEHFRNFIEKTSASDRHQWPIATITADRLREMGLPENARVVRLRGDGVARGRRHRSRYLGFGDKEWSIIQEVIDHGEAIMVNDYRSAVWHQASDGNWWMVIVSRKKGSRDVYMSTAFTPDDGLEYIERRIDQWKKHEAKKK